MNQFLGALVGKNICPRKTCTLTISLDKKLSFPVKINRVCKYLVDKHLHMEVEGTLMFSSPGAEGDSVQDYQISGTRDLDQRDSEFVFWFPDNLGSRIKLLRTQLAKQAST